jgi:hypothetical protein
MRKVFEPIMMVRSPRKGISNYITVTPPIHMDLGEFIQLGKQPSYPCILQLGVGQVLAQTGMISEYQNVMLIPHAYDHIQELQSL